MIDVNKILEDGKAAILAAQDRSELQNVRNVYLSKKGLIAQLMSEMKDLTNEEKPKFGALVNTAKQILEATLESQTLKLDDEAISKQLETGKIDITLSAHRPMVGTLHPLTIVQQEIEDLFISMGYTVKDGPEVELDFYNFERANIPQDHPARDMQDTFYINAEWLLRTHTTAIQTRALEEFAGRKPVKVICPGKVYRKDDDDATHSHQFVQIEGLVVNEGISMADLKGTLELLARRMFGQDRVIRFRPSYFQFTEPSVEVDVSCHICGGSGCPTCKGTGWIEILGAGMVHPNVLAMAGFDPYKVSGFAFGLGVERVALLKYGIDDIRHLYTNDIRFLTGFRRFE
ncbi:MAG: phenylalanine--tRNA ligase subunit alpha [Erysipelotrichales bacterium]|nr:MAG: phenylalanine--tRNA ligase subunit alpha [Erysipelotrichales bacterium]